MTEAMGIWPHGHRCAVVVTVDYNDVHGILTRTPDMAGRDKSLSVWRYGTTRGVARLLAIFEHHGITADWCIPGIVAEENPQVVRTIAEAGHAIACAGYRHEDFSGLTLERQRASLLHGCETLERLTGQRPTGFRTPAGSHAPGFSDALREAGIAWSSSWGGDDLPYLHPAGRNPAKLVEMPVHVELEDEPYFAFNLAPAVPASQARIAGYDEVLLNWQRDFEGFQRFGLCYVMRLHPEILGTLGRSGLLDRWLTWLKRQEGVWFATAGDVAGWWASQHHSLPDDHPAALFQRHQSEHLV